MKRIWIYILGIIIVFMFFIYNYLNTYPYYLNFLGLTRDEVVEILIKNAENAYNRPWGTLFSLTIKNIPHYLYSANELKLKTSVYTAKVWGVNFQVKFIYNYEEILEFENDVVVKQTCYRQNELTGTVKILEEKEM